MVPNKEQRGKSQKIYLLTWYAYPPKHGDKALETSLISLATFLKPEWPALKDGALCYYDRAHLGLEEIEREVNTQGKNASCLSVAECFSRARVTAGMVCGPRLDKLTLKSPCFCDSLIVNTTQHNTYFIATFSSLLCFIWSPLPPHSLVLTPGFKDQFAVCTFFSISSTSIQFICFPTSLSFFF